MNNRKKLFGSNIKTNIIGTAMLKKIFWKKLLSIRKNLFEHSSDFRKLEIDYPDLVYGFNWLLKPRCGYRFDIYSTIAKAVKICFNNSWPDTCPCWNSGNQSFEHWLLECPMFKYHCFKYLSISLILLLIILNLSNNVNLSNYNYNYNNSSIVKYGIDNSSSSNNINDSDNSSIYKNNNSTNYNNYNSYNDTNNERNNTSK